MKANQEPPKSYSEGKVELESIQKKLDNDDFNIDHLEELIDRGQYLIEYLTGRLRKIEDKLDNLSEN